MQSDSRCDRIKHDQVCTMPCRRPDLFQRPTWDDRRGL